MAWLHDLVNEPGVRGRGWAFALFAIGALFAVLTLGLAFSIFGEIAAVLAVASVAAGAFVLTRSGH